MDSQGAKRLAAFLLDHREVVLENWVRAIRETLRGRLTKAELTRQVEEIYGALHAALDGGGTTIDAPQTAELKGLLAELSRSRARHGFTATETAISVFAVKDAVLGAMGTADAGAMVDFAAFSSFVDAL